MVMLIFLLNPGDPHRLMTLCGVAAVAYMYQVKREGGREGGREGNS